MEAREESWCFCSIHHRCQRAAQLTHKYGFQKKPTRVISKDPNMRSDNTPSPILGEAVHIASILGSTVYNWLTEPLLVQTDTLTHTHLTNQRPIYTVNQISDYRCLCACQWIQSTSRKSQWWDTKMNLRVANSSLTINVTPWDSSRLTVRLRNHLGCQGINLIRGCIH